MILFICQALSIFTVSLSINVQGKNKYVSQSPRSIELTCGESSAAIHCVLSTRNFSKDERLVWFRFVVGSESQREKIGEINLETLNKTSANDVELWWNSQNHTAGLWMTHLKKNHSGLYGCELVIFDGKMIIEKDQSTNLTVTDGSCHAVGENGTNSNVDKQPGKGLRIEILLAAVISALLIVALLIYIAVMYWSRKQDPNARPSIEDVRCQGEEPISTVCSSDYAELKVPTRIDPENPTLSIISDDSYYATIMFSPQEQAASLQKIPANN